MNTKIVSTLLCSTLLLSACGSEQDQNDLTVRSAEVGVASAFQMANGVMLLTSNTRPAASMGVFISSFLSQGVFINVASAMNGIEAQQKLLAGQNAPTTSETFTLLTELATLMQVDIPDMLNRSTNRVEALNSYIRNLEGTGEIAEQKYHELEISAEQLEVQRREERDESSTIEREINAAYRNEDYSTAATKQEKLLEAESTLAQTDIQLEQTKDMARRFKDMLEIADERLEAIVRNREILIAGLRVTELPGIESLDLLEENSKTRRNRDRSDIFGTEHISK